MTILEEMDSLSRPKVISFDVYDTCISRVYSAPRDLFEALGERLLESRNNQKSSVTPLQLKKLRIAAERKAHRSVSDKEAVTLPEIYQHLMLPKGVNCSPSAMMELELSMELEAVYPIASTLARINNLRRSGYRIIFISDMYFSEKFIRGILKRFNFIQDDEPLYVSSEYGLTKRSGNLFRHVLSAEGIKACELLHVGDDPKGDISSPARLGIHIDPFRKSRLSSFEKFVFSDSKDRLVLSKISALSKQSRLQTELVSLSGPDFIHGAIAPFLVAYVAWVLREARRKQLRRLYFVARDGEILYEIAKILAPHYPEVELRYLYGSRKAWLLPSISFNDSSWKRLIVTAAQRNSIIDILERLEFESAVLQKVITALNIRDSEASCQLSYSEALYFLDRLIELPEVRVYLEEKIQKRRLDLIQYFKDEGLLTDSSWAFVDVGWSLNTQAAIKRIFSSESDNIEFQIEGFYIGLAKDFLPQALTGRVNCFIDKPGSIFSRRRVVVEHLFTPSTHASTIGYESVDGRICPIFGDETRSEHELDYVRTLHQAISGYTYRAKQYVDIWENFDCFKKAAIGVAANFISCPAKDDIGSQLNTFNVIADLRHNAQFQVPLCRPLALMDVIDIAMRAISKKSAFRESRSMWLEGSALASPIHVKTLLRMMLVMDNWLNSWKR